MQVSSPAIGLLRFWKRVIEEWISILRVIVQVQTLLQGSRGGGEGPVVGRLAGSGALQLLTVSFTGRRLSIRVLTEDTNTTTVTESASGLTWDQSPPKATIDLIIISTSDMLYWWTSTVWVTVKRKVCSIMFCRSYSFSFMRNNLSLWFLQVKPYFRSYFNWQRRQREPEGVLLLLIQSPSDDLTSCLTPAPSNVSSSRTFHSSSTSLPPLFSHLSSFFYFLCWVLLTVFVCLNYYLLIYVFEMTKRKPDRLAPAR